MVSQYDAMYLPIVTTMLHRGTPTGMVAAGPNIRYIRFYRRLRNQADATD